jgi:hypothetical protein
MILLPLRVLRTIFSFCSLECCLLLTPITTPLLSSYWLFYYTTILIFSVNVSSRGGASKSGYIKSYTAISNIIVFSCML